jgi:AcrR family transcriptional regulator
MNKITPKNRGRPRQFDQDEVLDRALELFWARGLSGTSLDDLSAAMNMKRPSLHNAFGDKETLYRHVLARFVARMKAESGALLFNEPDLGKALGKFFDGAIKVYCTPEPALGCFVMCTATLEAATHPEVRADLKQVIAELDQVLSARFSQAREAGQLPSGADVRTLAQVTQSILHSVALRSRAGESKAALRKMSRAAVKIICTSPLQ